MVKTVKLFDNLLLLILIKRLALRISNNYFVEILVAYILNYSTNVFPKLKLARSSINIILYLVAQKGVN